MLPRAISMWLAFQEQAGFGDRRQLGSAFDDGLKGGREARVLDWTEHLRPSGNALTQLNEVLKANNFERQATVFRGDIEDIILPV